MVTLGLYVRIEAKAGREDEVEEFLRQAQPIVEGEPDTVTWFAIRLAPTTFAIFDAFADERGRDAHLGGQVAAALMRRAPDLLAEAPVIEKVDVLASKLPRASGAAMAA